MVVLLPSQNLHSGKIILHGTDPSPSSSVPQTAVQNLAYLLPVVAVSYTNLKVTSSGQGLERCVLIPAAPILCSEFLITYSCGIAFANLFKLL